MQLIHFSDSDCKLPLIIQCRFENIVAIPLEDAEDAIDLLPECILIDTWRELDVALLRRLRSRFGQARILLVLRNQTNTSHALMAGIDDLLLFPYDDEQAASVMERVVPSLEYCDPVTGLSDAQVMHKRLTMRDDTVLMLINIDRFSTTNALYGMAIGNKLLKKVGSYLQRMVATNCSIFRIHSDEFALLIEDPRPNQPEILAKQIKSFFEITHFSLEGISFNIRVSIGMASTGGIPIFEHAAIALHEAKERGRNTIVTYAENSNYIKKQRENLFWINEVKSAMTQERLVPYYQPIHDNRLGIIEKYESLCRIVGVDGMIYEPKSFLGAAQKGGLLTNITRRMIDATFKAFELLPYQFSINVTKEDFSENYLIGFLRRKCSQYGIIPSRVFIEIVESIRFDGDESSINQINELEAYGFRIAIDDFGMESSNLSRLLHIKATFLKIDGRFIRNIDTDVNSQIIVENIVQLAEKIGAKTIAEYVANESVYKKVCSLGVDFSQGYFTGRPCSLPYSA